MTCLFVLVGASVLLCACVGVADCRSKNELSIHVSREGQVVAQSKILVAMLGHENNPFTSKPQKLKTGSSGEIHTTFETMWGGLYFIIPPIGLVPSHPPKPIYSLTIDGNEMIVSPDTPHVKYHWKDASWHTDASVKLP